jgi:hypothetical protein
MPKSKDYTLFKKNKTGLKSLTNISAENLFVAKMKARMQFKEEEIYIVNNTALKKIRRN